jgi:hypothetical protein
MRQLVYEKRTETRDALFHHNLDATAHIKNKCTGLMLPPYMIHRQADICVEAQNGYFEKILPDTCLLLIFKI